MSTGGNEGTGGGDWRPPDPGSYQPPGEGTPPPPGQWGAPPSGQQWQQPPYGGQAGGQQVPNHLVWSILTTIFCCMPLGIVSIVFSTQVGTKQAQGDYAGAMESSRKARTWAIVSAVIGLVVTVLVIAGSFLGAFSMGGSTTGASF